MDPIAVEKPHAVCVPYPVQGHINGMLKLANVLHYKGFHITFVNTEHSHRRILNTGGPDSLNGTASFRFETIPVDDVNAPHDVEAFCKSIRNKFSDPFRELVSKLNHPSSSLPPVTCIISDLFTSFTLKTSSELDIPNVFFGSASACGYMGLLQLVQRGVVPLLDNDDFINGDLDAPVDWIPGMKNIRLRDLPSFMRITNPDDIVVNFLKDETEDNLRATAIVINTFDDLEGPVLDAISLMLPPIYTIGPLNLYSRELMHEGPVKSVGLNFWKEDSGCLEWLEGRKVGSVVYVNFGSTTIVTHQQLVEFAWGLADSGYDFIWVIRPDLMIGDSTILPPEFLSEISERSMLASWCPQEEVLQHQAIGGFLTHCGWNSTMESLSAGVPMICWPFFAEQPTNCHYMCTEWGVGIEINNDVRRDEVNRLVTELMEGEKGMEMKAKSLEWKETTLRATQPEGTSYENFDKLIKEVILKNASI